MSGNSNDELMRQLQQEFLEDITFLLEDCEKAYLNLEKSEKPAEELALIFRLAHSIKGGGAAFGFPDLAEFAHLVEDCLALLRTRPELLNSDIISLLLRAGDAFKTRIGMLKSGAPGEWNTASLASEVRALISVLESSDAADASPEARFPMGDEAPKTPQAPAKAPSDTQPAAAATAGSAPSGARQAATVKIDTGRIDALLNLVGELVVIKSQLMTEAGRLSQHAALGAVAALLDKNIRELQERALSMRMTPLKFLFTKLQRVAREISLKLDKPVEVSFEGEETEIDRNVSETLLDAMIHMVRNSVDHGLEPAEARRVAGKPATGRLLIRARQTGSRVAVEVRDDGGGINVEKVRSKAVDQGLIPADAQLSPREVQQLIFAPGFSTADRLSDVSGRGVGLDVVKTSIEKLRGALEVESEPGRGTSFQFSIPITTAILDGMLVTAGERVFVIPTSDIRELLVTKLSEATRINDRQAVIRIRDRLVPVFPLAALLNGGEADGTKTDTAMIIVVEHGRNQVGLCLDAVAGQTQVVLKPLDAAFRSVRGVSGTAILGDGTVALVLDPGSLFKNLESDFSSVNINHPAPSAA